jgi:hypothetical protein
MSDLSVSNSISIVADAYASEHFFAIRYIEWAGAALDRSQMSRCRVPASCCGWEVSIMAQRLELQAVLEDLLGSEQRIFPASCQCANAVSVHRVQRSRCRGYSFADNSPYRYTKRYQVTVIDRDPDSEIFLNQGRRITDRSFNRITLAEISTTTFSTSTSDLE